nr:beta-ketoacyl synthase N-terminal-like domain-containing protein [Mycobacterium riyadhense]
MGTVPDEQISPYLHTGMGRSLIANRVSRALSLSGPSLTVDTGQSSSLVAVHLACESLRRRECGVALAGGVNLILSRHHSLRTAKGPRRTPRASAPSAPSGKRDSPSTGWSCGPAAATPRPTAR